MTHRPKSTERLNDDAVLEQIAVLTSNHSGMIQTNFGRLQSEMTSFFDTTVARLADSLLHPGEEPNWDALNQAALTIEAYFIVCDLFVQNEHLASKALNYLNLVKTGIEQLWRLRSSAPYPGHEPEEPRVKPQPDATDAIAPAHTDAIAPVASETLGDLKREWHQDLLDLREQVISEAEYYRRRRDHFERARALPPAPEVTDYLYAIQSEFETRMAPQEPPAPELVEELMLDWERANSDFKQGLLSKDEYIQKRREQFERARSCAPSPKVTTFLYTLRTEIEDLTAPPSQTASKEVNKILDEALNSSMDFGEGKLSLVTYNQRLVDLLHRAEAQPASTERDQGLSLLKQDLDEIVRLLAESKDIKDVLEQPDAPAPEAEEPGPADGGDIIPEELKLLELDVLGADKELVSGLIFFPVWRERMMQLFERGKRTLPLDDERRHEFLVDKMLARVGSLTSEGAKSIARENLRAAGALDAPRTEPTTSVWGGSSGIIIKAYH